MQNLEKVKSVAFPDCVAFEQEHANFGMDYLDQFDRNRTKMDSGSGSGSDSTNRSIKEEEVSTAYIHQ